MLEGVGYEIRALRAHKKLRQLLLISLPRQPPGSSEEISAIHGFFIGFLWPVRENRNHETTNNNHTAETEGAKGPTTAATTTMLTDGGDAP